MPKYHIGGTRDHIGAIKIATVNLENKIGRVRGGTHRNRCVRNSTKKGAHIGTLMWDLSFCSEALVTVAITTLVFPRRILHGVEPDCTFAGNVHIGKLIPELIVQMSVDY